MLDGCRGQTYSTVLTSVEDHRVVDVLPTREAGPLAAWLIRHPGVEIICRDRGAPTPRGLAAVPPVLCRSPTGSIEGRAWAAPWRPASPPTAIACAIARHLGRGLSTVLRYTNAAHWQGTIRDNRPLPSRLDPCKPYLERRLAEGCTSVTPLHGELVAEQAPVTCGMVRAHIATLRGGPAGAPPCARKTGRA